MSPGKVIPGDKSPGIPRNCRQGKWQMVKDIASAATTAASLEAEQDSGGGLGCQETMRDTIAQTRFENVSKQSNDLLLARGNALRSDEDRLKLNELMVLCTNLQTRVLDLEKIKTTQHNKIVSLKRRVKKLEKRNRSKTHKLKRLYKVGLTAKVESFIDEESLDGEEVFVARKNENVVEEVDDAQVSTVATSVTITTEEITLAQALEALKTLKPKAKIDADHQLAERLQAQEQEELAEEKRNKPPTQAQQRKTMCTYLKNMEGYKLKDSKLKEFDRIQEMFEKAFKMVNTFKDFRAELVKGKEKRAGEELIQESTKKQKVEDDKETA
nr:hypothetical protein [Tanacetum cinerariifolium]